MSPVGFAILCLLSFVLPVPLLAWLDRPRATPTAGPASGAPNEPPKGAL